MAFNYRFDNFNGCYPFPRDSIRRAKVDSQKKEAKALAGKAPPKGKAQLRGNIYLSENSQFPIPKCLRFGYWFGDFMGDCAQFIPHAFNNVFSAACQSVTTCQVFGIVISQPHLPFFILPNKDF